ncbi:MAG: hypothetical protein U9P00_03355 [Pseudomonadota bacterium]|nr:hypothetical protein [Pseudomonadota bacterium]
MTGPRYSITEPDQTAAVVYLSSKLRHPSWPTDDTKGHLSAVRTFKTVKRDPDKLTTWCEKYLSTDQWILLKAAIRQARKRTADLSRDKPKSVTLSHKAWRMLSDLAVRDGVTLSAVIEDRLAKEWGKL